ncbi:dsRNA-gated channel SID-1 family protein [Acanthocheilonema viteae]
MLIRYHLHYQPVNGDIEDGVMSPGLDVKTAEPLFDNRSIYLIILVTTTSDSIITCTVSVKIYNRSQYSIILRAPKFNHILLNQMTSAVMPIAFRVYIFDLFLQMLKIAVKSGNNLCAFLRVQDDSTAFVHSGMLGQNSFMQVSFTRKASLMLLANSPLHIFVMMMNDDRACNIFAPAREHNRRKKFDIEFSNLQSTSLYPLAMMTIFYLTFSIVFLASNQLTLAFACMHALVFSKRSERFFFSSQRETDTPLIVLLDEGNSGIPSSLTQQEIIPVRDSHNILEDYQMDENKQKSMKRAIYNIFSLIFHFFSHLWSFYYFRMKDQLTLANDNLDDCYYNMACSIALGSFQTFNHMYSNVGYFLLGFLFLILIGRRCKYWKCCRCVEYSYCPNVFLNIGLVICLEAVASVLYDICSNPRTFHSDTLFVEVALILPTVRFYFVRHGGISLYGIFQSITFAIFFHFVGNILKDNFHALGIILILVLLLFIVFQFHLLLDNQSSVEVIPTKDWRKWLSYCWQLLTGNGSDRSLTLKK